MKLEKDDIFKLYLDVRKEEREIRSQKHQALSIYVTLLTALTGGGIFLSNINNDVNIYGYFLIGIVEILISLVAYKHYKSTFLRQAECMSVQAKLEQLLEIDNPDSYSLRYWEGEAIIPQLYVETRKKCDNSKQFIKSLLKFADLRFIKILCLTFSLIGVTYIIFAFINLMKN